MHCKFKQVCNRNATRERADQLSKQIRKQGPALRDEWRTQRSEPDDVDQRDG